jgi:serine beta-lactamase-like protein LACTB, mitochondrial
MKKFVAIAVAAYLLLGALAWWIADHRGWQEIPTGAPGEMRAIDNSLATESAQALAAMRDARERLGAVGLTAAVSIDGQVVWSAALGWADIATRTPATTNTVMRIGSTSKALTATVLARLVEQGVVGLDQPIGSIVQTLPNPDWARLTPRQLASHTAGLPDYSGNWDLWGFWQTIALERHFDDVVDGLAIFDDNSLAYEPGTKFLYSTFDTNLLGAVMESVAQEKYLELLRREVLEPLELTATGGDHAGPAPPGLATFYDSRSGRAKRWREVDLSQRWPGGGLLSTSRDLVRLCGGWTDAGYLSPKTVAQFWQVQKLASGADNEQGYALGWRAEPASRVLGGGIVTPRYHHGGITKGAMSWLVCYPQARLGVAINTNTLLDDISGLTELEHRITRPFFERARSGIKTEGN